jgi:hypothetical protein
MIDYSLSVSIAALMFSVVGLIMGTFAYARVVGFEKSTHRIEYRPASIPEPYSPEEGEEPFGLPGEELVKRFDPNYDPEDEL